MKPFEGITRYVFLGFFLSHIPITLLLDGQASLFGITYPTAFTEFTAWYASTFQDPHFNRDDYELWFRCFITVELLIQLPYFFVAVPMIYSNKTYPEWFRLASLVYAAQAITAIVPVLALVLFNPDASPSQRVILTSIYMPYLLVPLALVYYTFEPSSKTTTILPMTGATKTAMLVFFMSHVPITILIDSQGLSPVYHPQPAVDLLKWYTTTLQDHLMTSPHPVWFQSFVGCECLLQFPFFFVAIQQLRSNNSSLSWWFPSAALLYGAHVVTTMVPILAEVWTSTQIETPTLKLILTCIYAPYAIFPAWIAYWAATASYEKSKKE